MALTITLPKCRLGFERIHEPEITKKNDGTEKASYVAVFLFDKETEQSPEFQAVVAELKRYGSEIYGSQPYRLPVRRTNDNGTVPTGLTEGGVFMRTSTGYKPSVLVKTPFNTLKEVTPEEKSLVYAGCYVSAVVSPYNSQNQETKAKYVQLNVLAVLKLEDGEPLAQHLDYTAAFSAFGVLPTETNQSEPPAY